MATSGTFGGLTSLLTRPLFKLALLPVIGVLAWPSAAHADVGRYLDSADRPPIGSALPMGPEGVPQVAYPWGVEDNPVTVSQWALQHWSWWTRNREQGDLDAAMRAADWLLMHQRAHGGWEYEFDFNGAGVHIEAPWISAMAQGQAMSLLVRAYSATSDQRYLNAARLALAPFQHSVENGGVLADFSGVTWYEEYPTTPAQHVLNGFEFTLVGLHDLADYSSAAGRLFDAAV